MDDIWFGLNEQQRDTALTYARERGLALETGADQEEGEWYARPLPGDEGAPHWKDSDLEGLDALLPR